MARCGGTAHTARGAATVHTGFSGEAGQQDEEGDALHIQELIVMYGMCNMLGEPLWVRVRREASQCEILVGDKAPAIRVRKCRKTYLSKPWKSPDP